MWIILLIFDPKPNTTDVGLLPNTYHTCLGYQTPTKGQGFLLSVCYYICPGLSLHNKYNSHITEEMLKVMKKI
jgi:hypothetical protein